jgi:hypothetical protein
MRGSAALAKTKRSSCATNMPSAMAASSVRVVASLSRSAASSALRC